MQASRRCLVLAASAAGLGLAACTGIGPPRRVTLSASDIQRRIDREFPLTRRLLDVFDVTLPAPAIELLPETHRIGAVVELQARERLLGGTWHGRLQFDAELRWDAADQSLRMVQVRVRDLAWRNPDAASRSTAERLSAAVAERMLEGGRLYRMPAEVADRLRRQGVVPGGVDIDASGVEITLVPADAAGPAPAGA